MSQAENFLTLLGGKANIVELVPCITRLRAKVADPAIVDQEGLKTAGAFDVILTGSAVQVVIGPGADALAQEISALR